MSGSRPRFDRNPGGMNSGLKSPLLKFTTDINPACFSGPIPFSILGSAKGNGGPWSSAGSYPGRSHDRSESPDGRNNSRPRSSGGYNDQSDEDRRHRRYRDYNRDGRDTPRCSDRDRDRDRDRGRDRDRTRDRDRDRSPRDRDRDRTIDRLDRDRLERSRERDWKEEVPNSTIMVRGLDHTVKETDIRNEVAKYGLEPKDIRLIREKDTGASRGFAFVEFALLSEAVRWKELTKSMLAFGGPHRATLHYSIPKDLLGAERTLLNRADWTCSKCAMSNFRRRDYCFKCNSPRELALDAYGSDGYTEVSSMPLNTLLFRNLDISTTEERVLAMLGQLTHLPIKSLRVAKHSVTNTSRGFAFVELHSTSEAAQLHDLLLSMDGKFYVDGRPVTVSYAKRSLSSMNSAANANAAVVALAAAQWTNQESDIPATPTTYGQGSSITSSTATATSSSPPKEAAKSNNSTNNTTAVAGPSRKEMSSLGTVIVNGVSYQKYALPDASTYQFDESSGYYYDVSTGLYYDANSQYYYNSQNQQYLYWDNDYHTYLPASIDSAASTTENSVTANLDPSTELGENDQDKSKNKREKVDKVKIAKKIAKDMEKWAKTLNQKKENAKLGIVTTPGMDFMPCLNNTNNATRFSASADAGFAVLEKRTTLSERSALMSEVFNKQKEMGFGAKERPILVASYGDDSESDNEADSPRQAESQKKMAFDESRLTDWTKLACLLCKRQFPSKDILIKHQQLSDLHKKNLAKMKASHSK